MGLANFFRPKHKHSDPAIRAQAVRQLGNDEAEILAHIAASDESPKVRVLAIERLDDPEVLVELAQSEIDAEVKRCATERAAERLRGQALGGDEARAQSCVATLARLEAQGTLVEVASRAKNAAVKHAAIEAIEDAHALADLFREAGDPAVRAAALDRITDGDVLRALGVTETRKDAAFALIDRMADRAVLEAIASHGKTKAIRARARRKLDREAPAEVVDVAAREAAAKRARVHAERVQLLRRVEGLSKARDVLGGQADMARWVSAWGELEGAADGELAARFEKAVARFEKRLATDAARLAAAPKVAKPAAKAEAPAAKAEAPAAKHEPKVEAPASKGEAPSAPPEAAAANTGSPADKAESAAANAESAAANAESAGPASDIATSAEPPATTGDDSRAAAENARAAFAAEVTAAEKAQASARSHKAVDRALARAEQALAGASLPGTGELRARLETARTALIIRARELSEADNWRRWANAPRMEALITKLEGLRESPEDPSLFNQLRDAQAEWKKLGAPPRERGQELWNRFKAASDAVYALVRDQRASLRAVQAENLAEKEKLCEAAEALSGSTDWAATAREIKALQAAWQKVGPVARKHNEAVWKRFRAACDQFFERRRPHLEEKLAEGKKTLAELTEVVAGVEQAAEAENLAEAEAALAEARNRWRRIGRAPRKEAAALRPRLDAAAAKIAERRDAAAREAQEKALAAIAGARDELSRAIDAKEGEAAAAAAIALRAALRQGTGDADQAAADAALIAGAIEGWPEAFAGTDLDPRESERKMARICARVESVAPSQPAAEVTADASPEVIAERLRAALAKNALGGAASGPDPAAVVAEAREAWTRLGPVPGQVGAELAERFRTACERALGS